MATTEKIITHENGPAYAHWATEATLESLLDCCKKQGFSKADVTNLINQLEGLNENGKVDTAALRGVLNNLKKDSNLTKERDKTTEEKGKKELDFWQRSQALGRKTAQAFKDSNLKDQLKGAGDMFLMPVDTLSDAFVKVAGVVGSVGNILGNFGKKVIDNIKILGKWGQGLLKGALGFAGVIGGLATTVIGGILGVIEQLGDSFFELYDTGINFAKGLGQGETGLGALAAAAANARLTVGEFAEFIAENSRVAVAIGADAMGALSNTVRTALYPLGNLGLTAAETNEHLGEYLEMQRTLGVLETLTGAQQARASADYLTNLTLLTQITGKRRKQIAADMKTAIDNTALTAWMMNMNAEERKQAMKNTEAVTGVLAAINPEAANAFTEALGKGNVNLTEYGISMQAAGFTQEMAAQNELIRRIHSGDITEAAAQQEMLRIQRMMRANGPAMQQLYNLARAGDSAAIAAVDHMKALQQADLSAQNWSKRLGGAEKAIGSWDEMQRSVSQTWTNFIAGLFKDEDFAEGINEMADKLSEFLKPDGDFAKGIADFAKNTGPKLIDGLQSLGASLPGIIEWFEKLPDLLKTMWDTVQAGVIVLRDLFFEEVKPPEGKEGVGSKWVMKDMSKVMSGIWTDIKTELVEGAKNLPWGTIALAIAGIFAGKALLNAVTGGIARKLTGGGVTPGPKGADQTMGGTLGKNIGGFVGGIGEGVLKGAAAGLAAFGGPQSGKILIGAGVLGAAIFAIAAGIAGAQWILSKSMGPFAESLKGFEELDGDALRKTGWGMSALGVGLTAMGAGGVIGAIGNLIGAGFEEIGKLVGVDTMTRLKEFGEAGKEIDIDGVRKAAEGMAAFAGAMAKAGGGSIVGGIGTLVTGIATGLNSLMGVQTDPIAQMTAFGKTKIPLENIENNALAMAKFQAAMSAVPTTAVKGERTGGWLSGIVDAVAGIENVPWAQVKIFAEADLGNTTKLASNAIAMQQFNDAMSGTTVVEGSREGMWSSIVGWFKGSETMPWDQLKIFGSLELNSEGVIKNAKAMTAFSAAMGGVDGDKLKDNVNNIGDIKSGSWTGLTTALTGFQAIDAAKLDSAGVGITNLTTPITALASALPKDIQSRLEGFGKGLEELADYIDDGELKHIGILAEHLEKINLLGPIFDGGLGNIQIDNANAQTRPSRLGANNVVGALDGMGGATTTATAELVNAENQAIDVNASMLTSATNREAILSEIKVILEDLNKVTKAASDDSNRKAKQLITATKNNNEWTV